MASVLTLREGTLLAYVTPPAISFIPMIRIVALLRTTPPFQDCNPIMDRKAPAKSAPREVTLRRTADDPHRRRGQGIVAFPPTMTYRKPLPGWSPSCGSAISFYSRASIYRRCGTRRSRHASGTVADLRQPERRDAADGGKSPRGYRPALKALVWEDADGKTWIAYNDPQYIVVAMDCPGLAADLAAAGPGPGTGGSGTEAG